MMKNGPIDYEEYSSLMVDALNQALSLNSIEPFTRLLDKNVGVVCIDVVVPDTTQVLLYLSSLSHNKWVANLFEQLLQDPRIDPAENYNEVLRTAATNGYIKSIEILLKDPRVEPNEALYSAAASRKMDAFMLLFQDPRIDPNKPLVNKWLMNWAINNKYQDILYSLCSRFPDQLAALKKLDANMYKKIVNEFYQKDLELYNKLYQIGQDVMLPTDVTQYAFVLHTICAKIPIYMPDYVDLYLSPRKAQKKIKQVDDARYEENKPSKKFRRS